MKRSSAVQLLIVATKLYNHSYGRWYRRKGTKPLKPNWTAFAEVQVKKLVMLIPHPDDEVIGCAGLIITATEQQWPLCLVYITDGSYGFSSDNRDARRQQRMDESLLATDFLGRVTNRHYLHFPDGESWIQRQDELLNILIQERPSHLLLPHPVDPHSDHRQTFQAVAAIRERLDPQPEHIFYQIRTPIPVEQINLYIDLTNHLSIKREALRFFVSQQQIDFDLLLHLQACQGYLSADAGRSIEAYYRTAPDSEKPYWPEEGKALTRYRDVWPAIFNPRAFKRPGVDRTMVWLQRGYLFARDWAYRLGYRRSKRTEFETMYAQRSDPWDYETSRYESDKRNRLLQYFAGKRYGRLLELGCSIGVNTEHLAEHCDHLAAIDIAAPAVNQAKQRCQQHSHVHISCIDFFDYKAPPFDLVLCSEVLYYWWDPPSLRRKLARKLMTLTRAHSELVLVWGGFRLDQDWNGFLTSQFPFRLKSSDYFPDDNRPFRISIFERTTPAQKD